MSIQQLFRNIIKNVILKTKWQNNNRMFKRGLAIQYKNGPQKKYDLKKFKDWEKKWSIFGEKPLKLSFQTYQSFCNQDSNIVASNIVRNFIEPILTPNEYQPFYNDKNSLSLLVDETKLPKTIFRDINGLNFDGNYDTVNDVDFDNLLSKYSKVIVKPAKGLGGKGIMLFTKKNNDIHLTDDNGNKISLNFLKKTYKSNFLIQECLRQNEFMSYFNKTSINTFRIAVYRDVNTGKLDFLCSFLRIGNKNCFVDNSSSGGIFIGVDYNGKLSKYGYTLDGKRHTTFNDIDFENNEFIIPNWEKIKLFATDIAKKMPHMCLFASDIAIDENDNPILIEMNTMFFGGASYQFFGDITFGKYTDSILEYCAKRQDLITPYFTLKYN